MKKIILIIALTVMATAGHYIWITQPDGNTISCYVYDNGTIDCSQ